MFAKKKINEFTEISYFYSSIVASLIGLSYIDGSVLANPKMKF